MLHHPCHLPLFVWCLLFGSFTFIIGDTVPDEFPVIDTSVYPVCAETVYKQGNPDMQTTLYNCMNNISYQLQPPSYCAGADPVSVYVAYKINNLMQVSELAGTITMEFFFKEFWMDPRINIPTLWPALNASNPAILENGAELNLMVRNQDTPLNLWLPDLIFYNSNEIIVMEETIRLRPGGQIFWSRRLVVTLQQPQFDYTKYPSDQQTIAITAKSFAYKSNILLVNFTTDGAVTAPGGWTQPPPVKVQEWGGLGGNPVWDMSDYQTSTTPEYAPPSDAKPTYTFTDFTVVASRKPAGIIYRLGLPIMLMLLLVGLTFWSEHGDRLDTTITILLAVSALYIVIFSSIPMLGYLTDFDNYIIAMFVMIVATIFLHQFTVRAMSKAEKYPLRLVMVRVLECAGKLLIIPGVYYFFVQSFPAFGTDSELDIMTAIFITMTVLTLSREGMGLQKELRDAIVHIRVKVDAPTDHVLTTWELLVFNLYMFGIVSRSAVHYHRWKRQIDKDVATTDRESRNQQRQGGIFDAGYDTSYEDNNINNNNSNNSSSDGRGSDVSLTDFAVSVSGSGSGYTSTMNPMAAAAVGDIHVHHRSLPRGEMDLRKLPKTEGDYHNNLEGDSNPSRPSMYEL